MFESSACHSNQSIEFQETETWKPTLERVETLCRESCVARKHYSNEHIPPDSFLTTIGIQGWSAMLLLIMKAKGDNCLRVKSAQVAVGLVLTQI